MTVLADHVDERSEAYQANRAHLLDAARRARPPAGARQQRRRRQVRRPPPPARQAAVPRARRAARRRRRPAARAVAARRLGHRLPGRRRRVHRRRRRRGHRVRDHRQRPDRARRHEHRRRRCSKTLRAMAIAMENRLPLLYLVESGGADLPHQSEIFIPGGQSFRDLTRLSSMRHPDDRPRVRQLDRRRRLRAGHVRLRRDDRPALEGVPRRPAAGQDGDRRGERRREPRRRRHARRGSAAWPTTSPSTSSTPCASAARSCAGSTTASSARALAVPGRPPRHDPEQLLGIPSADLRVPFDPRDVLARLVDDSDFDEFKPRYGTSLVTGFAELHGYPIGVLANHRGVLFNEESHKATQFIQLANQIRHAAAVPAEHDRLHGRQGVRAAGHGQGRLEDDQRRHQLDRAPPHGQHGAPATAPATTACAGGRTTRASCSRGPTPRRR